MWDPNIYYSPEHYNLQIVGELEKVPEYDFDKVVVWRELDGEKRYLWSSDYGCSCPSPFEDVAGKEDLMVLTLENFEEFEAACARLKKSEDPHDSYVYESLLEPAEVHGFVQDIRMSLKGKR